MIRLARYVADKIAGYTNTRLGQALTLTTALFASACASMEPIDVEIQPETSQSSQAEPTEPEYVLADQKEEYMPVDEKEEAPERETDYTPAEPKQFTEEEFWEYMTSYVGVRQPERIERSIENPEGEGEVKVVGTTNVVIDSGNMAYDTDGWHLDTGYATFRKVYMALRYREAVKRVVAGEASPNIIWGRNEKTWRPYPMDDSGQFFDMILSMDDNQDGTIIPLEAKRYLEKIIGKEIRTISELKEETKRVEWKAETEYYTWFSEKVRSLQGLIGDRVSPAINFPVIGTVQAASLDLSDGRYLVVYVGGETFLQPEGAISAIERIGVYGGGIKFNRVLEADQDTLSRILEHRGTFLGMHAGGEYFDMEVEPGILIGVRRNLSVLDLPNYETAVVALEKNLREESK